MNLCIISIRGAVIRDYIQKVNDDEKRIMRRERRERRRRRGREREGLSAERRVP